MIYTRNGDDGFTTLHGVRISKASLQCEVLGSLDELNCLFGLCKVKAVQSNIIIPPDALLKDICQEIQHVLFAMQALSAGYQKPINASVVNLLEFYCDAIEQSMQMPTSFGLAGGTELAAFFDYVRTVVRRVERVFVSFYPDKPSDDYKCALFFLNRLSSFMYASARYINFRAHEEEVQADYSVSEKLYDVNRH